MEERNGSRTERNGWKELIVSAKVTGGKIIHGGVRGEGMYHGQKVDRGKKKKIKYRKDFKGGRKWMEEGNGPRKERT